MCVVVDFYTYYTRSEVIKMDAELYDDQHSLNNKEWLNLNAPEVQPVCKEAPQSHP